MQQKEVITIREDCEIPTMEFDGFGRAYVPQQQLCKLYSGKDAFLAGTIFPELNIPPSRKRRFE